MTFILHQLAPSSLLVVDIDLGTASGLLAFTEIILEQGEFPNWEKIILGLGPVLSFNFRKLKTATRSCPVW